MASSKYHLDLGQAKGLITNSVYCKGINPSRKKEGPVMKKVVWPGRFACCHNKKKHRNLAKRM
jgi:hypothetical protein